MNMLRSFDMGNAMTRLSIMETLFGEPSTIVQLDITKVLDFLINNLLISNKGMNVLDLNFPFIKLTKERYVELCKPFSQALVIKLLGRNMGFYFLHEQLMHLWKRKGLTTWIDVGNDFYVLRFTNPIDHGIVLLGDLWMASNHYLTV